MAISISAALTAQAVVIDASVWISNLLTIAVNHLAATRWITQHIANGGQFKVPTLIVPEIAGALARVTQSQTLAHGWISQFYLLHSVQFIPIDQPLVDAAADYAIDFGLRGADAVYVAVARQLAPIG